MRVLWKRQRYRMLLPDFRSATTKISCSLRSTRHLQRRAGLPTDLKNILTNFVENKEPSAILGRVLIASRLAILHDIDPEWTEEVLLPYFDWTNPTEARGAWQGFLWSPWVAELIGEIEHGDMVLDDLAEKQLDTLHPESALILVDRITPDAR